MRNLEIPADAWQALQARAILDSTEEVSWPGKAIVQRAPKFEDEEIDVTYHARYIQGWLDLSMNAPVFDDLSSTLEVWRNHRSRQRWTELPCYRRRKQRSPARMSKEWRERRKAMEGH